MTPQDIPLDPFGPSPDPRLYVSRPATEHALERLELLVRSGGKPVALTGPPGIGKTLLLRVLAQRLERQFRVVTLLYPSLPVSELCDWALRLAGAPRSPDPERDIAVLALRESAAGSGLALIVDDVAAMPLATAQRLGELVAGSEGALRLIVASLEDARTSPVLQALGPELDGVSLRKPLDLEEAGHYVQQRLAAALVPEEIRQRFDPATLARLHRESDGVPRELNRCAAAVLHGPAIAVDHRPRRRLPETSSRAEPVRAARTRVQAAPPPLWQLVAISCAVALAAVAVPWLRPELPVERSSSPPRTEATRPSPATMARTRVGQAPTQPVVREPSASPTPVPALPVTVSVNARPWARISIDGVALGVTPLSGLPLLPGSHLFRAEMPDGRVLERRVEVGPESRHVSFD